MSGTKPKDFPALGTLTGSTKLFTQSESGDYHFTLDELVTYLNSQGLTPAVSEAANNAIESLPDGLFVNSDSFAASNAGLPFARGTLTTDDIGKLAMVVETGTPGIFEARPYQQSAGKSTDIHLGRVLDVIGNVAIIDGAMYQPFTLHLPAGSISESDIKDNGMDAVPLKGYDDGKVTLATSMEEGERLCGYAATPAADGEVIIVKML